MNLIFRAARKPPSTGVAGGHTYFRKIGSEAVELPRQEAMGSWTKVVAAGRDPGPRGPLSRT